MIDTNETIAAISTPRGEGGIAVVRISGPQAFYIAKKIFLLPGGKALSSIDTHKAIYGYIIDTQSDQKIDEAILLAMQGPKSYTREDTIEIHCHGGILLVNTILSFAIDYGARPALPGEFTMRAFLNGRIDLAQAEAVADLIKAGSRAALKTAASDLEGRLSSEITDINNILTDISASLEASIDFPEDDIEISSLNAVKKKIDIVIEKIGRLLSSFLKGRIFREGISVVIAGRPNVGKSTLLNTLIMEDRSIVTPYPGTTRDIIEESITVDGIQFRIKDTAGLRAATQKIEEDGIKRAKQAAKNADIIIFVIAWNEGLTDEDIKYFREIDNKNVIITANKTDMEKRLDIDEAKRLFDTDEIVEISAKEDIGLDKLRDILKMNTAQTGTTDNGYPVVTRLRHQQLLLKAKNALIDAVMSFDRKISEEFIAIDINSAISCIEEITGKKVSEDVLDKIFSEFCIGK